VKKIGYCSVLFAALSGSVTAADFIDQLPVDMTLQAFTSRYPQAILVLERDEPIAQTLHVAWEPANVAVDGQAVQTVARGFVGEISCAAGTVFAPLSNENADSLVTVLKQRHDIEVEVFEVAGRGRKWIYLQDSDIDAAILDETLDSGERSIGYSVVLRRCPRAVARVWQVIPQSQLQR
jgi:hypothetical protein